MVQKKKYWSRDLPSFDVIQQVEVEAETNFKKVQVFLLDLDNFFIIYLIL